ncbi:Heme A synthase [Ostreococcus tauri]|uniref:Heme A synthase n=2 Tax=Ostreococcus tauri TaxID=70448 RepID=A0A096PBQ7_OSTTA|nr:Heme A synthase [Ostreococcus tauri]CEG02116.1 Heme A synthase [Ostreococcus tauri]|eukprot:XP_003083026.2 Heme A synthase [Ostreococcus tauri]
MASRARAMATAATRARGVGTHATRAVDACAWTRAMGRMTCTSRTALAVDATTVSRARTFARGGGRGGTSAMGARWGTTAASGRVSAWAKAAKAATAGSMTAGVAKRGMTTAASPAITTHLVVGGDRAVRQVAWWLGGGCAWVFSMVVLGGMTRLTRSGLSMTDWKFEYEHPPLTDEDWAREFEKYKQSPEYKKSNLGMTVEEYKFIYWMEYGHRMWGRVLGLYFVGPLAYFASKGYITSALAKRLGVFFVLGATQGMIGWWMVKSGLEEQEFSYDVPRVSPYRLATHLTGAFTIYTGMLWTTLNVIYPSSPSQSAGASQALIDATRRLHRVVHPLAALIGVTAISGAYVAGMDAGRAYNTFPLMGGRWIPEEYLDQWDQKGWRNFFENTAAVQFDHRVLALTTLASVTAVWLGHRNSAALHPRTRVLLHALLATTAGQVTLGITTLLHHVPVELGSAHQAGALTLFTVVLALMHSVRGPKRVRL